MKEENTLLGHREETGKKLKKMGGVPIQVDGNYYSYT